MTSFNFQKQILAGILLACCLLSIGCKSNKQQTGAVSADTLILPAPYATKSVINECWIVDWPKNKFPVVPAVFTVSIFADEIKSPRWLYETAAGDILLSCSQTNTKVSPN